MTAEIIYGVDFRAKRRLPNPLEELAVQIMGEITVFAMWHEPDTAPCECPPSGPWTDGAA